MEPRVTKQEQTASGIWKKMQEEEAQPSSPPFVEGKERPEDTQSFSDDNPDSETEIPQKDPVEKDIDWKAEAEKYKKQYESTKKSYDDIRPEFDRRLSENRKQQEELLALKQELMQRDIDLLKGPSVKDYEAESENIFTTEEQELLEDNQELKSIIEKMVHQKTMSLYDQLESSMIREEELQQQVDQLNQSFEPINREATMRKQIEMRNSLTNFVKRIGLDQEVDFQDRKTPLWEALAYDQTFADWINQAPIRQMAMQSGDLQSITDTMEQFLFQNPGFKLNGIAIGLRGSTPPEPPRTSSQQVKKRNVLAGVTGDVPGNTPPSAKIDVSNMTASDLWDVIRREEQSA